MNAKKQSNKGKSGVHKGDERQKAEHQRKKWRS